MTDGLSEESALKAQLLGEFLLFCKVFYPLLTGRPFFISNPAGREPHLVTMAKTLKDVFNMKTLRLVMNTPPGHHKSSMCSLFVAWCYANYPDCNFLYVSVSYELAEKHTFIIKQIMELPEYRRLFNVKLRHDSKAKGIFTTEQGGACTAFGAKGSIVGCNAGLPNEKRFTGAVIMDDMHLPNDVHSDTIRQRVIDNFNDTIKMRPRSHNVPIIFIGQRLHEEDLPAYFIAGRDGHTWKQVVLRSLDEHDNPLYPEVFTKEMLIRMRETDEYNFYAQHQQNPQPSGGGIFKRDWFVLTDIDPPVISTFITIDSAETDKSWNDATAMSFFGVYRIVIRGIDTGEYGLHWIDCREMRVEPKDLESEFFDFYMSCMRYRVKPNLCAIERKSTGTTLASILKGTPGLRIMDIMHASNSGSKTARYYECQKYVGEHRITIPRNGKHTEMCLEHVRKITSNGSHAHDDIADTLEIGIRGVMIDESLLPYNNPSNHIIDALSQQASKLEQLRRQTL